MLLPGRARSGSGPVLQDRDAPAKTIGIRVVAWAPPSLRFLLGEDDVHSVPDQLTSGGGKGCHIPLGEADAENELLVLAIAQL